MSENLLTNLNKENLFTFLRYSFLSDNMIYGELAEKYISLKVDDKWEFREKIIEQLELDPQNEGFIKDYREIEQKINEHFDNKNLFEIYSEEIIELCKAQKKTKRLQIIDELNSCLEKCSDEEILDFLKSIDSEIDPTPNDNSNSTNLKRIRGKYKREIEGSYNPENEIIFELDFVLNVVNAMQDEVVKLKFKNLVDAMHDEVVKLKLKRLITGPLARNSESENFLIEVANFAETLDLSEPKTKEDDDDFLGLRKFFSDVGEVVKPISDFINKFTPKDDSSLMVGKALKIFKEQKSLHKKFIDGTFAKEDKSKLLSAEELIDHHKILLNKGSDELLSDRDSFMQDHKLIHAILNKNIDQAKEALEGGANPHIINVESLILFESDDFASEMIKILNNSFFESSPFIPKEPIKSMSPLQKGDEFWNKQYRDGNTAIHLALLKNKKKTVQALLDTFCIDPKINNNEGKTASDLSSEDESFKILLEYFSINRNSEKIVHFINQKNSPNQKLISAIKSKEYDEVEKELKAGANIYDDYYNIDNLINRLRGKNPPEDEHENLMIFKFAKALYGENPNEIEKRILDKLSEKQTPDQNLIHAVRKNNLDEVKDAIDSGANINCTVNLADDSQAQYHMRLFSFAYRMAKIKKDDYKIVNHLLKKGVDYFGLDDLKDDSAISKMIADLRENDCEITEFLNQKNINGDTPLHLACIGNKTQTAMQLIEAGVDTTAMNNQDKQAKDLTEDLGLKSLILPRELSSLGTHSSYPSSTASSVSARTSMSGRNI